MFPGISVHCVREEHTSINMNLHYLDNGTVMLNFIYQKELFFLPLGFALKVMLIVTLFMKHRLCSHYQVEMTSLIFGHSQLRM